ncbi:MAG: undecaprenyldiphospho-muramoylpentapeptide beta-N-acetylglucosaminyltransferase [bacterium]|nr:undecaprenyldiphospho-muramoylpentapeptide beta-N-acetylglucosaminyltransferase [bacterium]
MRIVLTGGGTGGHVYPALAIAEALRNVDKSVELHFIGTAAGFEAKAVPSAGEIFHTISSGGIIGKSVVRSMIGATKAGAGVFQSFMLLRRLKPDVVVGTGGFVMAPVLFAARTLGIPYFLQEQNSYPGLSTRKFAKGAKAVFIAYSQAQLHLPNSHTVLTGNPLRRKMTEFATGRSEQAISSPARILVTGGSLGARSINNAVADALEDLCAFATVTWQLGKTGIPEQALSAVERQKRLGRLIAAPFFEDMPTRMGNSDIVVCRAGAMTLSEIALFGVPAILIPFPHAAHDHQTANAKSYSESGAAELITDSDLSGRLLLNTCHSIVSDSDKYKMMSRAMQSLARPNAALEIVMRILRAA